MNSTRAVLADLDRAIRRQQRTRPQSVSKSSRSGFRPIGAHNGDAFPQWLVDLDGKSGSYTIRQHGKVVYIGESHTGRLRQTLSRHFQAWSGPTSGPSYDRQGVDVAITITAPAEAVKTQNKLIARYDPRDNRRTAPTELEEAPF